MARRPLACALAAGALVLTSVVPAARAAMLHDELFDGDLPSADGDVPVLQASIGSNKVRTLTGPRDFDSIDVFELALPAEATLERIVIDGYRPGQDNASSSFGVVLSNGFIDGSRGVRLTVDSIGEDVIRIAESGSLRFGIGEDSGPAELQVDFVVVPEPATAGLLAAGLTALAARRTRPA